MWEWGKELEDWGKKVNAYITEICEKLETVGIHCDHFEAMQPGDPPPPPWQPS
jgi:hypothetical protein